LSGVENLPSTPPRIPELDQSLLTIDFPYRLEQNEKLVLTPFEKNIEVWRQLWRVVERSDLVVQIVDGRNPMVNPLLMIP
jgi:hypothetical protein